MPDWASVLTELIPLALVISLSPLSIIPAVIILQAPRPRTTALAYLISWLLASAILTAVFLQLASLIPHFGQPSTLASWVRIAIGALLIAFGGYRWITREPTTHEPAWMRRLSTATPTRAFATAQVLAVVNPKVLFVCIAAGLTIDTDQLKPKEVAIAILFFAIVAGSSVAIPVLTYVAVGKHLDPAVQRLGVWLHRQHKALVAAIVIAIGLLMVYKGIHHL
jgi:threonine/homoserine/homoserine lactone efflux protein